MIVSLQYLINIFLSLFTFSSSNNLCFCSTVNSLCGLDRNDKINHKLIKIIIYLLVSLDNIFMLTDPSSSSGRVVASWSGCVVGPVT